MQERGGERWIPPGEQGTDVRTFYLRQVSLGFPDRSKNTCNKNASGKLYKGTKDYFGQQRLELLAIFPVSSSLQSAYFQREQTCDTEDMSGVLPVLPQLFKIYLFLNSQICNIK